MLNGGALHLYCIMAAGHISIDNTFKLSALDENRTESGAFPSQHSFYFVISFYCSLVSLGWWIQRVFVISVTLA